MYSATGFSSPMSSVNVSPVSRSSTTTRAVPLQAHEEVVLAALVVVQPADDALPREGDVRLARRLGELGLAADLDHPAALVLVGAQRDALEAFDHALFAPLARTKSFTA